MLDIGKSTVYYHAKNHCRKMSKFDLGLINDDEKGYIIGLFLGDGSFNRGSKEPRYFVRFALDANRDEDIAFRLTQILAKSGKKTRLIPWKSNIIAKTCSTELVTYIRSYVEYSPNGKNLLETTNCSTNFKYGLVAGMIDSDGHVHEHLGTEIKTVSQQISKSITEILRELGMSAKHKAERCTQEQFFK